MTIGVSRANGQQDYFLGAALDEENTDAAPWRAVPDGAPAPAAVPGSPKLDDHELAPPATGGSGCATPADPE